VILYLPVPLQIDGQGHVAAIPGFDPLHDTLAGPDNVHVAFKTPTGLQDFDLSQGTHSRVTFYTASGHFALGGHKALEIKARLRTGSTLRNGLFPVGRPMTGTDYLASVWPQLAAAFPPPPAPRCAMPIRARPSCPVAMAMGWWSAQICSRSVCRCANSSATRG
jgi:hypothetical protein